MNRDEYATDAASAIAAEASIIGCLLLDNNAWDRVGDQIKPDHFFHETHRAVFGEVAGWERANWFANPGQER